MMDKNQLLKNVSKTEDKFLISKILDKVEKANKQKCRVHTDFLDPYQRGIIERAVQASSDIEFTFEGGYIGAERVITNFCPDFIFNDDDIYEIPLKIINIKFKVKNTLTHRDYLGALMSLGIKREKIGDILVKDSSCDIVVLSEIADYIGFNLQKIGNIKCNLEILEIEKLEANLQKTKEISTTVSSLRLDSISSAGFGISRSKIVEFIKAYKLNLNWEMTNSLTKQVKEGDTISIKGKGRIVLDKVGGITKKGRIGIILKKYI